MLSNLSTTNFHNIHHFQDRYFKKLINDGDAFYLISSFFCFQELKFKQNSKFNFSMKLILLQECTTLPICFPLLCFALYK